MILALKEVKQGDLSDLPESARKQAWADLSSMQGDTEMAAVMEALKEQAIIIPSSSEQ